jgi:SOS response associated peptidase (SRAP)
VDAPDVTVTAIQGAAKALDGLRDQPAEATERLQRLCVVHGMLSAIGSAQLGSSRARAYMCERERARILAVATARLKRMCGRYSNASTNPYNIAARFEIKISDATAERALGRTNIAATQSVLAVVNGENGERQAILARFGLAPAWAKLRGGHR